MAFIIFFRGLPGVGKSAIARALSKILSIAIIDYDDVKGELVGSLKNPELPIKSYNIVKNIINSNIFLGNSIIFDSHGFYKETLKKCTDIIGEGNVVLVNCVCTNEEIWNQRLINRTEDIKPSQINNLNLIKESENKMESLTCQHWINIDTLEDIDLNVNKIVCFLRDNNFL